MGEVVRGSDGEPIETGKLNDRTKAELQLENAKELEGVRQGDRKEIQSIRQSDRLKAITARAEAKPSTAKAETPQAKQQRIYNRAVEAINKHPEWRAYIDVDKIRKVPDILTPQGKKAGLGKWFGGTDTPPGDPKVAKEILDYIYGDESASVTDKPANPNRQKAIDILTKNKKPITDANIDYVLKQLEGK